MSESFNDLLESMVPSLSDAPRRAAEYVRACAKEVDRDLEAIRAEAFSDRVPASTRAEIAIRSDELSSMLECLVEDMMDGDAEPEELTADIEAMKSYWRFPRYEDIAIRSPSAAARIKGIGGTLKVIIRVVESLEAVE